MKSETALRGLIELYENDFRGGYEGDDSDEMDRLFLLLIVAVTRFNQEIRYCTKPECQCSPESHISRIVQNNYEDIMTKLIPGEHGLTEVSLNGIRNFLNIFVKQKEEAQS